MVRLIEARHVGTHKVWLIFSDGVEGEVNLAAELDGPIFEPLKDPSYFRSFRLHSELHTLVWPNGADFAPEFLRDCVQVPAQT